MKNNKEYQKLSGELMRKLDFPSEDVVVYCHYCQQEVIETPLHQEDNPVHDDEGNWYHTICAQDLWAEMESLTEKEECE